MNSTIKNTLELSVSELSVSIKNLIENNFGYVRVKGEIGRVSNPASGHVYFDLKDKDSVISGIVWKGNALWYIYGYHNIKTGAWRPLRRSRSSEPIRPLNYFFALLKKFDRCRKTPIWRSSPSAACRPLRCATTWRSSSSRLMIDCK